MACLAKGENAEYKNFPLCPVFFLTKAFASNKINVIKILKFALGRIENMVGREENVGSFSYVVF